DALAEAMLCCAIVTLRPLVSPSAFVKSVLSIATLPRLFASTVARSSGLPLHTCRVVAALATLSNAASIAASRTKFVIGLPSVHSSLAYPQFIRHWLAPQFGLIESVPVSAGETERPSAPSAGRNRI